ncbi:phosphopantetheine-binding protein [Streptomyces sp. NPDC005876]|jgi:acyl carrier protein|uniref:acyl carrier protein n=1 Tax=unclassified Streptomyces TaxID=2593676 RepID=UPI0033F8E495
MSSPQTMTDEITGKILAFLSAATGGRKLTPDQDYIAEGLIDSLLALELVTRVETLFGIEVEVDDLDLDNFRTASRVAAFVSRKRGAPEPADG